MRLTAGVPIGSSMSWLGALAVAVLVQPDPTTTVLPTPGIDATSTAADNPAQQTLVWIIGGLLLLAAATLVVTVVFWRRTRPGPAVATPAQAVEPVQVVGPVQVVEPVQTIAPVRVASPDALRDVPLWADEPTGTEDVPR